MLYALVVVIHVLVALFLIIVILLQGGRGGLGEALGGSGTQSLFGGGANLVMTKLTAVVGTLFMVTCLSLAALSTAQGRSVIDRLPASVDQLPFSLGPGEAAPTPSEPIPPAPSQPTPGPAAPPSPDAPPTP
ncbi:MAG: preprotein translocase subunit SecG [Candidatus Omnitrophica bacterium]|nr:preprotein translocase subunit SecG [Candidatus Omnitrophota bacterium]